MNPFTYCFHLTVLFIYFPFESIGRVVVQSQCREAARLSIALFLHHCNTWIRQSSLWFRFTDFWETIVTDWLSFGNFWETGWFLLGKPWYLVFPGLPVLSVLLNTHCWIYKVPSWNDLISSLEGSWGVMQQCSQIPLYPIIIWRTPSFFRGVGIPPTRSNYDHDFPYEKIAIRRYPHVWPLGRILHQPFR